MNTPSLAQASAPFLDYIEDWLAKLPVESAAKAFANPEKTAIVSVDVIKGFCTIGPLASPRVNTIVAPIVRLFSAAWKAGVRNILQTQDSHEPDAVEFGAFPPHCVRGTEEAETMDEIKALPFFKQIIILPKNSIASGLNAGLLEWLDAHPAVDTFIVVGDCTDLCTYQLAMHLRLDANTRQLQRRVVVPMDCVDTYDRTIAIAQQQGGFAHHAELLHAVFLYSMALNGIEVLKSIR
jgi:nicotinamidase-related amidase